MRDETEPIYINASAEVKKLQVEKAALIKRLTEIHAEIDAYGYLHPNNHPLRQKPPGCCTGCDWCIGKIPSCHGERCTCPIGEGGAE